MKQVSPTDFKRLEQKINLLSDKIDRIMEVHGIALVKGVDLIEKEELKKRRARERQQQKLLEKEHFRRKIEQMLADRWLKMGEGMTLMREFNLVQPPAASRIREYLRTKDPKVFDGLKRVGPEGRK